MVSLYDTYELLLFCWRVAVNYVILRPPASIYVGYDIVQYHFFNMAIIQIITCLDEIRVSCTHFVSYKNEYVPYVQQIGQLTNRKLPYFV